MDSFFDEVGRDMVIMDWFKRYKPEQVKLYQDILDGHGIYKDLNEMILAVFEAGIDFARISERNARCRKLDQI